MSFDDHTSTAIDSARRRLADIRNFQIPNLRKCESSLADQRQLSTELREDMDNVSRLIEELAVAIEDQQGEKAKNELKKSVNEMRDELSQLRKDTRAALLASKKVIDSRNTKAAREELLSSSIVRDKQTLSEKVTDDALMKANDDVTETLRRTINLMQGELERSVLTTQMLDGSTATLRATSQTHDTLNSVMLTSKHLITALEKSDWLDRILIISAFTFFILVVLFVLKQRFIDRGLRIALWWTRLIPLPDFSTKQTNILRAAEEGSISLSATLAATTTSLANVAASISPSVAETTASIASEPMEETKLSSAPPPPDISPVLTYEQVTETRMPADPLHVEL